MMKLALLVPALTTSGGVQAVARFVRDAALRSGRYELRLVSLAMSSRDSCSVRLAAPRSWRRGAVSVSGEWEGHPFVHVGALLAEFEFQRYQPREALSNAIADCDLIQVVSGSPAWANAVVGLGKPVALQVATRARTERLMRSNSARTPVDHWRSLMTHVTDLLDERALRHVDAVQVENPWMLDHVRAVTTGRNVDVRYAPPGVDDELYRPVARDAQRSRYVLCVGRMADPRKNVRLLLRAFARIPSEVRTDTRLILAGASSPTQDFWYLADALGVRAQIEFRDRPATRELIHLYQHATAFALPSDEEGLGVVVLEAMACGVPVVSTRSGGPDAIIDDGVDGYLVARGDEVGMAARLHELLTTPALNERIGSAARATIQSRYQERAAGDVFISMWDQLSRRALPRARR